MHKMSDNGCLIINDWLGKIRHYVSVGKKNEPLHTIPAQRRVNTRPAKPWLGLDLTE